MSQHQDPSHELASYELDQDAHYLPARDVHAGRPVAPEYRERGERLMQQWAREDLFGTYQEEK